MTKLEFLKLSFGAQAYGEKAFCQSIISIQTDDDEKQKAAFSAFPYGVYVSGGKYRFMNPETNKEDTIEGKITEPLFYVDTLLSLPGDFHPFLNGKAYDTTFGIFWFNIVLLWEVFQLRVPYNNGEFTGKFIKSTISALMVDNPEEGATVPEGKASVDDCLKFTEHCYFLEGLGMYFIRAASVESLTVDPSIIKRKKELFEEHKDSINDPVVFGRIVDELVAMDFEIQKKVYNSTFYIEKKYIDNSRKRMFIAFGLEYNDETGSYVGIKNSLDDGWEVDKMVDYINTGISSSYSRGKATGEGGAGVKELIRLVGRSKVTEDDCGSTVGEHVQITKENHKYWQGASYLKAGKPELLSSGNSEGLIGKVIQIRVPQYCQTKDGNFCAVCVGEALGTNRERASADVVQVATSYMLGRMKMMHMASGGLTRLDLKRALKVTK